MFSRRLIQTARSTRRLATHAATTNRLVNIVEVGPRDGLQNESSVVSVQTKVDLIKRLTDAGLKTIEAGSFVSPKWVPQMAGTSDVIKHLPNVQDVRYPVLVPNQKGLDNLLALENSTVKEVSVFTAASDAFNQANLNMTVSESLKRLEPVVSTALKNGFTVRGYVSVVISCPFSGPTGADKVAEVSKALVDMGCYEISLGDTVGTGTPASVTRMLEKVITKVDVGKLAGHFHDTYGMAIANVFAALDMGVRTFDSSIAGLGGCPYSPGSTGNLSTEDLVYALNDSSYAVGNVNLEKLVATGDWISAQLQRTNSSRVGMAITNKDKAKSKL